MLTAKGIKEEEQLEIDRKRIVEEYIKLGLVENCIDENGNTTMSKEELDDWEWDD